MDLHRRLADEYGTPLYVYHLERAEQALADLRASVPEGADVYYSLKANPHPAIARSLREAGGWPDTARPGNPAPTQAPEPEEPPDMDDEVVDEPTARQSSEEAALHLLAEALGAEKIGEMDNR